MKYKIGDRFHHLNDKNLCLEIEGIRGSYYHMVFFKLWNGNIVGKGWGLESDNGLANYFKQIKLNKKAYLPDWL